MAVLGRARQVAAEITRRIAELGGSPVTVDADEILTGRAALLHLRPRGRISAGGATRLLGATDGFCALTLSRADDIEAVPALLELPGPLADPWRSLIRAAAGRVAADLVARARLLGMPAAVLGETVGSQPKVLPHNETATQRISGLIVVDLSSMWAGPLCGRLLAAAGATVVKVESPARPDGTRAGHSGFFDWLNADKLSCTVDFDSVELRELLAAADIVIEGSRPAGLARRGLGAEQCPGRPGRVWLRITGYGSDFPDRVAFGDHAADPLAGLEAALAVGNSLRRGGGELIEVSMAAVAATYAALPAAHGDGLSPPLSEPRLPTMPSSRAHDLGADNAEVRRLIAARHATC
jgi:hypothetical protein